MRVRAKWIFLAVVALLVAVQLIPVARTNPPVEPALAIDTKMPVPPDIANMLGRSCQDCHSSQTVWPWYSRVAPVSWFIVRHVNEGRGELNFSEWGRYATRRQDRKLKEICEQLTRGKMPMPVYTLMHPQAKLTDTDRKSLCAWAEAARGSLIQSVTTSSTQ